MVETRASSIRTPLDSHREGRDCSSTAGAPIVTPDSVASPARMRTLPRSRFVERLMTIRVAPSRGAAPVGIGHALERTIIRNRSAQADELGDDSLISLVPRELGADRVAQFAPTSYSGMSVAAVYWIASSSHSPRIGDMQLGLAPEITLPLTGDPAK